VTRKSGKEKLGLTIASFWSTERKKKRRGRLGTPRVWSRRGKEGGEKKAEAEGGSGSKAIKHCEFNGPIGGDRWRGDRDF